MERNFFVLELNDKAFWSHQISLLDSFVARMSFKLLFSFFILFFVLVLYFLLSICSPFSFLLSNRFLSYICYFISIRIHLLPIFLFLLPLVFSPRSRRRRLPKCFSLLLSILLPFFLLLIFVHFLSVI